MTAETARATFTSSAPDCESGFSFFIFQIIFQIFENEFAEAIQAKKNSLINDRSSLLAE